MREGTDDIFIGLEDIASKRGGSTLHKYLPLSPGLNVSGIAIQKNIGGGGRESDPHN